MVSEQEVLYNLVSYATRREKSFVLPSLKEIAPVFVFIWTYERQVVSTCLGCNG
jgi:hypothetical protein